MSETETTDKIDVFERGMDRDGTKTSTNRRLFMQLHVFTDCHDPKVVEAAVAGSGIEAAFHFRYGQQQPSLFTAAQPDAGS